LNKEIVEQICIDLGVNQKELSEIMRVSQNTMSSWKNEKHKIPNWTLKMFELLRIQRKCFEYKNTIEKIQDLGIIANLN